MRAAVVRQPSGPFEIEQVRDPEPAAGEILVQVAACGVCHTDLHVHDGSVPFPFPCVLGHEVSGKIAAVGDGVVDLRVGDRVAAGFIMPCGSCRLCVAGREELCERFFAHNRLNGTLYDGRTRLYDADGGPLAMYSMGGLGELAVMPELAAARIPAGLPLADSAIFGCAMLTAYGAAHHVAALQPGESVAVVGAGGVGISLVQVARALGAAQVIAVDLAADKLAAAQRAGAGAVVDASAVDPVAAVRELTDGRGADVVFEAIGLPATFRQATEMAADGGRCTMIGIAPAGRLGEVEITRLVRRKLQILGSFGGRPRTDLAELMRMTLAGLLDPTAAIGRRFSLDQVDEAYGLLARGEIVGRAIVEM
ncbi:zinc-binding dehydrogenase [Conexibacter sp. CPCC 206217]|uniref:zinc-binding dehydrogenase n=1 Tax=Conexibacter sp. CPCC 206217 TaxID=3064574 RepID=UPI00271D708E|nr:zinc-binding dehydrogenase [Conexibacter sp. CPCC 206217]MDO8209616.1 zinc-binding dehydrogenase [Conexibacter sp. CPCC 206217]